VKDGSRRNRALIAALGALMHPARGHIPATGAGAARTTKPAGPALPGQLLGALRLLPK
jgi:hypothetical protein